MPLPQTGHGPLPISKHVSQSRHSAMRRSGRCNVQSVSLPFLSFTSFGRFDHGTRCLLVRRQAPQSVRDHHSALSMGQRETRDEDRVCGTRSAVMDPNGPETTGHERRDDCHQLGYQQAQAASAPATRCAQGCRRSSSGLARNQAHVSCRRKLSKPTLASRSIHASVQGEPPRDLIGMLKPQVSSRVSSWGRSRQFGRHRYARLVAFPQADGTDTCPPREIAWRACRYDRRRRPR